jgi:hypothetical protein
VAFYGSETWSFIFREERRLRSFDFTITILTRIFGPERDEEAREWRKQHIEELYDLFFSTNIVRVIESTKMLRVDHTASMGDSRGLYRVLVGKTEGKRPLGRSRLRWEENIKMYFQELGCGAWTGLICFRMGRCGTNLLIRNGMLGSINMGKLLSS